MTKFLREIHRYLQHVIAAAYICLYLFSPFFHHHSEANHQGEDAGLHSHVLGEIANPIGDADCHHTLDQVDDHDLSAEVEVVVIGLSPRSTDSLCDAVLLFTTVDIRPPGGSEEQAYVQEDRPGEHRGREYILSASNVSPPLV